MTTGQTIRKLVKDGFVIKKPVKIHSRARVTRRLESKRKGRYQGTGKLAAARASLLSRQNCGSG